MITEWIFSRSLRSHLHIREMKCSERGLTIHAHLQGAGVCVVVLAKRSDISLSFSWSLFCEASINSSCASSLGMSGKKSRRMMSVSACVHVCVCVCGGKGEGMMTCLTYLQEVNLLL